MSYKELNDSPYWVALQQRDDLKEHGNLNSALYALELDGELDDVNLIAPDIITEGGDDENIDILHVDREGKRIYLIQSFQSPLFRPQGAKPTKAQETSYAETALFSANINMIPARIRTQVSEARDALKEGVIERLNIWFVHNCPETDECDRPLKAIGLSVISKLKSDYPNQNILVDSKQIGLDTLDKLYNSQYSPILISDVIKTGGLPGFFEKNNEDWRSFSTSVSGSFLKDLHDNYGEDRLFSANVRSYMGSNKRDLSINDRIKDTAQNDYGNFFVYNNGVTALVHDFSFSEVNGHSSLGVLESITGISIVNGAQTTGSISHVKGKINKDLKIGIRFIKVNNEDKIQDITLANNSQNKVLRSDFRSSDPIQTRLRNEFVKSKDALYTGGLRKSLSPKQKRILLPTDTVAQILIAFHDNPTNAYHNKKDIWDEDGLYKKAFDDSITKEHIVFVFTLNEAIAKIKKNYSDLFRHGNLPVVDQAKQSFLSRPGVSLLIINAISSMMEIIAGRAIPNKYKLSFKDSVTRSKAIDLWMPVIIRLLTRATLLDPATEARLSKRKIVIDIISRFQSDMDMYRDDFPQLLPDFVKNLNY
ncbi:AIPR family protein [Pectobacterium versatile]|uniref:AIPR family protein n=1 Tax=Pectobacterium versatile TaxID=2488639 RepID=UPI001F1B373E|nr:AIPR family protein [Pectobacterium versatile]